MKTEKKSYGKLAKIGVAWGFAREAANSLMVLPMTIIMARLLTPEEFGIAAIAYFFLSLSARLTQFGFNAALVRAKQLRPEHASSVFWVNLTVATVLWTLMTALSPLLAVFWRNDHIETAVPVAALTFFFTAFGTVPGTLLSRDMRFRDNATTDFLGTITNAVVAIGLAWQGWSFWSIIYGHLAADIVRSAAKMWFLRWRPQLVFSRAAIRELFSFGAGVYVKNLLDYLAQNIDNLIVGRMLGLTALGFYDKAFSVVSRMIGRINLAGPSVSFRVFALIHEEPERFRRGYRKVILSITIVGYPLLTGMIVAAPELIHVLFGERWLPAVVPFQILSAAGMLKLLNTYASSATQAQGRVWQEVKRQAFAITLLTILVAGLSRWGISGAAAGVFIATAVMTVLMQSLIMRLTGFRLRDIVEPQVPAVVCAGGLALAVYGAKVAVSSAAPAAASWVLLLAATAVGGLYFVAFLLFARFTELRALVLETLRDFAPGIAQRLNQPSARAEMPLPADR